MGVASGSCQWLGECSGDRVRIGLVFLLAGHLSLATRHCLSHIRERVLKRDQLGGADKL